MGKLRASGGYRNLATFQMATIIYDATVWFCERFIDSRSRTVDQMVQAARSGRQNIAEGSRASATSSQTELRLVNVARASLEELLLDYEDFLRHRHLTQWALNSREVSEVRRVARSLRPDSKNRADSTDRTDSMGQADPSNQSYPSNPSYMRHLTDHQRYALYAPWLAFPFPEAILHGTDAEHGLTNQASLLSVATPIPEEISLIPPINDAVDHEDLQLVFPGW